MARIPREIVDTVRERTDISEVIGRHVSLQRRGRNFVGLCPFHQEKTPSFNVIPDKGIYHCFGCQSGGDVFKFLMTIEGLSFLEAVRELAVPLGLTIEERELSVAERKALKQRANAFDVLEAATGFYEAQLWTSAGGAAARTYLSDRGMSQESARHARLGWAPAGWSRLLDALHHEGFDPEQLSEAGVARPRPQGDGFYDTLRDRVTIPIRDERGRVIAFGGRLLEGEGPKYLNTPETRLYLKSTVLYGLDVARLPIQQRGRVLVVEGYFDVLSLHQAGFGEAVATCGTSLTPEHLERIRRLAKDVVLVMDADEAGLKAAERALPLFVDAGVQAWRVALGDAKDPDEFLRARGPEAFSVVLDRMEPLFEWVVQRKLDAYGTATMSRDRVLDEVLPLLSRLRDVGLTSRVASRLGISEVSVLERLHQHDVKADAKPAAASADAAPEAAPVWKPHRDLVHLLWLAVHRYDQVADVLARIDPSRFDTHEPVRLVLARLLSGEPVASLLPDVSDVGLQRTLLAVVSREGLYDPESAATAALQIVARLARPAWRARLAALTAEIERCATHADVDGLRAAAGEKRALLARERALDQALRHGAVEEALSMLASNG